MKFHMRLQKKFFVLEYYIKPDISSFSGKYLFLLFFLFQSHINQLFDYIYFIQKYLICYIMKFLTAASLLTLSSSALAAIKDIQLYAQSSNNEVNDFGISSRHEGAALNYLFLAAPGVAENLKYDDETKTVYTELKAGSSTVRQPLNVGNTVLQLGGSGDGTKVDIAEDGTLSFDGSDSVGAAKNINDPYNYSKDSYAVVKGGDGAIPIKLVAKFTGDDKESASSSSSSAAPEPTASSSEAPKETPVYSNSTVTLYTTYCPLSTTITLTVCSDVCTPTVIETSGSVTVSSVQVPSKTASSEAAPPKTTVDSVSKPAPSGKKPTAAVTSFEGAANALTGGSVAIAVAAAIGLVF